MELYFILYLIIKHCLYVSGLFTSKWPQNLFFKAE